MKIIQHTIKTLDFFGPKINFTIKRQENFKTVLGGFASLIVYCLYVFFFIYFGQDMIFKLHPNVSLESFLPENQENYTIDNETFIAWRIEEFLGKPYNNTGLFKSFGFYDIYDSENLNLSYTKSFKSLSCNENKFKHHFENSFYKANEWLCLDFSEIQNQNVSGSFTNVIQSYILFILDICELDYEKKKIYNCLDFKETRKLISQKELCLAVLYHETVFRPDNYEAPLQKQFKKFLNSINLNQKKSDVFYFQNTKVEQDYAILFSDEKPLMNKFAINKIESYASYKTDEELDEYYKNDELQYNRNTHAIIFYYEQEYKKYTRKYMKVQDVFGNVNGFMEFLILILNVIRFYTDYRFDYFLFNELVNVKNEKGFFSNNLKLNCEIKNVKRNVVNRGSVLSMDKVNVLANKDPKGEIKENENYFSFLRANNHISSKKEIDLRSINSANSSDTTRRIFNLPKLEVEIQNVKADLSKEASRVKQKESVNEINEIALNEETKKLLIAELQSIFSNSNFKKRYLKLNFFLYYCKSKDKKKAFDLKLQETYLEKINEKFDIIYYLKMIKQFKNLKKFVFPEKYEKTIFKLLGSNVYDLGIKDYNDDFFNSDKSVKAIVEQWVKSLSNVYENDFSKYFFNNSGILNKS